MLSKAFQETQNQWMEDIASNKNNLCDTIFVVGAQKEKMYGLRALLANISPVFRAQLYGNFAESSLSEVIEYPTIPPAIFKCILRVSLGLNPLITEHTAVPLIEASHMLQIDALQRECQYYLSHCINRDNVLFLLNSAYCLDSLDSHLYLKCRSIILQTNSNAVLLNEGFYSLHPDLIIDIISCDDFKAKEEHIWKHCLKWAQNVIKKSLKFPKKNKNILKALRSEIKSIMDQGIDDDDTKHNDDDTKHNDDDDDRDDSDDSDSDNGNDYYNFNALDYDNDNLDTLIKYILQPIIIYIRYPLMDKVFFIENVCKYLNREQSESVFIYFILNKPSVFCNKIRKSFIGFDIIAASKELESAKKLSDLNQDSLFCSQMIENETDCQWFIIDILFIGVITTIEIKNRYCDKDTVKHFKLQISSNEDEYSEHKDDWIDVKKFKSARTNSWQTFEVNPNSISNRTSRYWRIVLLDSYGGYTCINHLKLILLPA